MQVHNLDTARIRLKYIAYRQLRQKAVDENIPYEELKKQEGVQVFEPSLGGPKTKKKKFVKKKKAVVVEMCIKMKDKDGNVINFDEDEVEEEVEEMPQLEEVEEQKAEKVVKKDVKKKKRRLEFESVI